MIIFDSVVHNLRSLLVLPLLLVMTACGGTSDTEINGDSEDAPESEYTLKIIVDSLEFDEQQTLNLSYEFSGESVGVHWDASSLVEFSSQSTNSTSIRVESVDQDEEVTISLQIIDPVGFSEGFHMVETINLTVKDIGNVYAITWTITNEDTLEPIPNVEVNLYGQGDELNALYELCESCDSIPHKEYSFTTDAQGQIKFSDIGLEGGYYANVFHPDYLPESISSFGIYYAQIPTDISLKLSPVDAELDLNNPYTTIYQQLNDISSTVGDYSALKAGLYDYDAEVLNEVLRSTVPVDNSIAAVVVRSGEYITGSSSYEGFRQLHKKRYDKIVSELQGSKDELTIWKYYNMGVILKEGDSAIAVDLSQWALNLIDDSLLTQVDAFFASHEHNDHFDGRIALAASRLGKPYYYPSYMINKFNDGEWVLHNRTTVQNGIPLTGGDIINYNGWTIEVFAMPHNRTDWNNAYLITSPLGVTVVHTGDGDGETALLNNTTDNLEDIDFLISPIWQNADAMVSAFNAKVFIPSHFNEIGHPNNERYAYSLVENLVNQANVSVLFNGDSVKASEAAP